jgi:hypothetical protein
VVSFTKSKKILNQGKEKYSDEEIEMISELLTWFAKLTVEQFKSQQRNEKSSHNVPRE